MKRRRRLGARRGRLLAGAGLLVGAGVYAAYRTGGGRGGEAWPPERHELSDLWTFVDGLRWYVRAAAPPADPPHTPIVFVHGLGISSVYFVPAAERLAARYDVYAPDLPGHGRSRTPAAPLDVADFAEALRRWLSVTGIARTTLIGHSMGCQIAAELAVRYPEAVDRLVLAGPTLAPEMRTLSRVLPRFLAGGVHERRSLAPLIVRDYVRMGPRLYAELRATFAHRIEELLASVGAPVLLVRGEHDRLAPQRWLDALQRVAPDARQLVVPRAGHAAHHGRPDAFARLIEPFLSDSGGRSGRAAAGGAPAPRP